ncbi:VOC family protein [uncultured Jatrophihabitans sp.]|uniref:VOC family protein n=1 Tax=uncultured Jatrophihabitans sp. TaxID=1610747 RepID=UPI0035CA4475
MREQRDAFHLAIPTHDLDEAYDFYVAGLGCKLARRYDDRITLDFFGDQVVCHLSSETVAEDDVRLYPRHFGVTFREYADWQRLRALADTRKLTYFADPFRRFEGMVEEHDSFVLQDPSNNLLEFKHYADPRMMF